jgi:hypothetical protein
VAACESSLPDCTELTCGCECTATTTGC